SLNFPDLVEWTEWVHSRRARESLPDGQRTCLGLCHCLHARRCISVGGQTGGFWCVGLAVGGTELARSRMEHRARCHSRAGLVGFETRKHSCPVAPVVRSAPST